MILQILFVLVLDSVWVALLTTTKQKKQLLMMQVAEMMSPRVLVELAMEQQQGQGQG